MARAYDSDVLVDAAGNALAAAVGTLYTNEAATTPVTDAYTASSGGSPVATVTTNSSGKWELWFDAAQTYYIKWANAGHTAYPVGSPSTVLPAWTPFVARHVAREDPADEITDDTALAAVVTESASTTAGLAAHLADTADAHDASAISVVGAGVTSPATDVEAALTRLRPSYNVLDYGADPTGVADSLAAFSAAILAAGTHGKVIVPPPSLYYRFSAALATSTVGLANGTRVLIEGIGGAGSSSQYAPAGLTRLKFDAGGIVCDHGLSGSVGLIGLSVEAGPNANAFICNGPKTYTDRCTFKTQTSGYAQVAIGTTGYVNGFWYTFDKTVFYAPDDSTPWVVCEDQDPNRGWWDIKFRDCVGSAGAGVRFDVTDASAALLGFGVIFDHFSSENQNAKPLCHIRNMTPNTAQTMDGPTFIDCAQYDASGDCDLLLLETTGTGALTVNGTRFIGNYVTSLGHHIHTTGTAAVNPDRTVSIGRTDLKLQYDATIGSGHGAMFLASGSGWDYRGRSTTSVGVRGRYYSDAADRWRQLADGSRLIGDGTATPAVYDGGGAGSPESAVTSAVSGTYRQFDGAAGSLLWLKATGAGNTGWVAIPDAATIAYLASQNVFTAAQNIRPTASGAVGLRVRASTTSPGNIQQWDDSSGTLISRIKSNGGLEIGAGGVTITAGGLVFSGSQTVNLGTGLKLGSATSQPLGLWNTTPIVQPTTAIAAATLVGGGGTALTDSDTFDGYTLKQVVKALRNMGALA